MPPPFGDIIPFEQMYLNSRRMRPDADGRESERTSEFGGRRHWRAALGRPAARAAKWPPAGSYPDRAASALASRTNSAGDSVSPRRAPSMPAAASASSTALSGHGAPVLPGPSPRPRRRGEGAASGAGPPDALAAARSAFGR